MKRLELKCYECGQTLGYMSIPTSYVDNSNHISSTMVLGEVNPICCPICEVKRIRGDEK